jgi:hypothetical protein
VSEPARAEPVEEEPIEVTEDAKRIWARAFGFDLDELRVRQRLDAARALREQWPWLKWLK